MQQLLAGVASFFFRLAVPVGQKVFWLQLGYFVPYILLFVAGCCAAREKLLEKVGLAQARPWMIVSTVAFVALPAVLMNVSDLKSFTGGWPPIALFYALWDPLMGWGIILGLLWSFRTWFSGGNAFTDGLARRA